MDLQWGKQKFSWFCTINAKYSVFSSKQSFEGKHIFKCLVIKFIDVATSSWPAGNYWTLRHISWQNPNETLDLTNHETLKTIFAIFRRKMRLYMCFISKSVLAGRSHEGNWINSTTIRWSIHLMECKWLGGTPNMKCNKRIWSLTEGWQYRL